MTLSIQSASIKVVWNTRYWNSLDLNAGKDDHNISVPKTWTDGTGDGQSNRVFHDQRSINADSDDDIDLNDIVSETRLKDALGQDLAWTKLKAIFIDNLSIQDLKLESYNSPVGLFSAVGACIAIPALSMFCLTNKAGWAMVAGESDNLRIVNYVGSLACNYNIRLLGSQPA